MRMTPTVIIVGILALLIAITLTVVYWPYATRDMTPSDIFRQRSAVEEAGRKIYLENGCVYCHSQSIRSIGATGLNASLNPEIMLPMNPSLWGRSARALICPRRAVNILMIGTLRILSIRAIRGPIPSCPPLNGLARSALTP